MTRILRAVLVAALALSLLAVAGCGGDTEESNDYVAAVNKAQTDFVNTVTSAASTPATTPEAAKDLFDKLEASTSKIVGDLKAIEPPEKVKDLHERLVSEVGQIEASVTKAQDAVESGDAKKAQETLASFATEMSSVGAKVSATIAEINTKLQE